MRLASASEGGVAMMDYLLIVSFVAFIVALVRLAEFLEGGE